jgi:hypothetical protein
MHLRGIYFDIMANNLQWVEHATFFMLFKRFPHSQGKFSWVKEIEIFSPL